MGLQIGIVGLPNVGKSTLFKILTNQNIEIANYPFATINPNIGIVKIPDKRIENLQQIYKSKTIIPCVIEFVDIAGLVKGASEGKGLGNQFLNNIRDCDAICNVVRLFKNNDIIHVDNSVDAVRDIETIDLELIIADLQYLEKRSSTINLKKQTDKQKNKIDILELIKKAISILESQKFLNIHPWTEEEKLFLEKECRLLTIKSRFVLINTSENQLKNLSTDQEVLTVKKYLDNKKVAHIFLCLSFEQELMDLESDEKVLMLNEFNLDKPALENLILTGFNILNLNTFFTCGPKEIHAWNFKKGSSALECAGLIHTDIQKGFIKAEIIKYDDIIQFQSEQKVKENGKLKIESKDYKIEDGDICHFRFNL